MITEKGKWQAHFRADYYDGNWTAKQIAAGLAGAPFEVREASGNLLVNAGINLMESLLIGGAGTPFSEANAHIGVGDSATAAAAGQTDLQAATNKVRKAMDSGYPAQAAQALTFRSTFGTGEANHAIQEVGVFNAASGGTMLNRKVQDLGTKTSASTLQLTVTITIS